MDIHCSSYIFANKYDALITEAFDLVKSTIYKSIDEIIENQEFGITQKDELMDINKYYFLINYMVFVRRAIDNYIDSKEDKCITEEEINQFKQVYKIDCIIESGVCNKFTNNIVNIFLKLPTCNLEFTYEWVGFDSCVTINNQLFAVATNLIQKRNDVIVSVVSVDEYITVEEFALLLNKSVEDVEDLFESRFLPASSTLCCNDPVLNTPVLLVTEVEENRAVVNLSGNALFYTIKLDNITDNTTRPLFTSGVGDIELLNLLPNKSYRLTATATNCKGDVSNEVFFLTDPIIITVYAESLVEENFVLNVILGDEGNLVEYGSTFTISFEDLFAPFLTISSVFADGLNVSNTIAYSSPLKNIGFISFPYVTQSFRVDLFATNACETIIEYWEVDAFI